jgi:hypothetical protein
MIEAHNGVLCGAAGLGPVCDGSAGSPCQIAPGHGDLRPPPTAAKATLPSMAAATRPGGPAEVNKGSHGAGHAGAADRSVTE